VTFPCRVQLVAAMNPCPCGLRTAAPERCTCDPPAVRRYAQRVSGPLLDRIDLQVDVRRVPWRELGPPGGGEPTSVVRGRVLAARERALRRTPGRLNAELADAELAGTCRLDAAGEGILAARAESLRLSARTCRRILRVARTLADLAGSPSIAGDHVLAAVRMGVPGGDGRV